MSNMAPSVAAPPNENDGENEQDEQFTPEEYNALDAKLDELNFALDAIEQKSDLIRDELIKLLHSNREIRDELRKETEKDEAPAN